MDKFFYYELDFARRWIPKLEHSEPLPKKTVTRSQIWKVNDCPGMDIDSLVILRPAPAVPLEDWETIDDR